MRPDGLRPGIFAMSATTLAPETPAASQATETWLGDGPPMVLIEVPALGASARASGRARAARVSRAYRGAGPRAASGRAASRKLRAEVQLAASLLIAAMALGAVIVMARPTSMDLPRRGRIEPESPREPAPRHAEVGATRPAPAPAPAPAVNPSQVQDDSLGIELDRPVPIPETEMAAEPDAELPPVAFPGYLLPDDDRQEVGDERH